MSSSGDRRALIERMLKARGVDVPRAGTSIERRPDPRFAPASPNQEGLWFLEQLERGNASYNIPGTVRLRGSLHLAALEESLATIVARHESLRTTFAEQDGSLVQIIAPVGEWTLPRIDLTGLEPRSRQPEAIRRATEEARRSFDLAAGPLFRARLLKLGAKDHVLTVNFHHSIADGWSMGIFSRELKILYNTLCLGRMPALPPVPLHFGDFAVWQRRRMSGRFGEESLSYWAGHLAGAPAALDLPTDHPRPRTRTHRGAHYPVTLPARVSDELRALAQRLRRSLFAVLLAAFEVVVHVETEASDVVVGCTFGNRVRRELEGVFGHFANTMPVRSDLSGDPTFEVLLGRISEAILACQAHQELPFPLLVKELHPGRDASRTPIYQLVFDLLTPDRNPALFGYGLSSPAEDTLRLHGLTIVPMDVEGGASPFDLSVFLWDLPNGLSGTFEYSTDLFEAGSIGRLATGFEFVVRQVLEAPEVRLSEIAAALRRERRRREQAEAKRSREKLLRGLKQATRRPVEIKHDE